MGDEEGDPLAAALAELDGKWEDPALHQRVLALADTLERLGEVGTHYRAMVDAHPERAPALEPQIDRLLGLALTRVARAEKTVRVPSKNRLDWIAFGVSAALIAAALWSMLHRL